MLACIKQSMISEVETPHNVLYIIESRIFPSQSLADAVADVEPEAGAGESEAGAGESEEGAGDAVEEQ